MQGNRLPPVWTLKHMGITHEWTKKLPLYWELYFTVNSTQWSHGKSITISLKPNIILNICVVFDKHYQSQLELTNKLYWSINENQRAPRFRSAVMPRMCPSQIVAYRKTWWSYSVYQSCSSMKLRQAIVSCSVITNRHPNKKVQVMWG